MVNSMKHDSTSGQHKNIPLALELADRLCVVPYDCASRTPRDRILESCESGWLSDELARTANERFTPTPAGGEPIVLSCLASGLGDFLWDDL